MSMPVGGDECGGDGRCGDECGGDGLGGDEVDVCDHVDVGRVVGVGRVGDDRIRNRNGLLNRSRTMVFHSRTMNR